MTFALPTVKDNCNLGRGAGDPKWLADINAPTNTGTKAAGSLPITGVATEFDNNSNGTTKGYAKEFENGQSPAYDVSTDTKVMLWHNQSNAPNRIQHDTVANGGVIIRIYSGTGSPPTNYRDFYVGGNDTPNSECIKGQYPYVIDLNDATHDASSGTFDNTDVTSFAILVTRLNLAGTSTSWNYQGKLYVCDTTKTSSDTPTFSGSGASFQDAVDLIQGSDYTDKLGNWVRKIGDVIFVDLPFRIGDNSTATTFNDNGATIISPVANDSNDPRVRITTQAMRVYLNLRNNAADTATFSGTYIWQTRADWDFDQDDAAVVTFNSPTFRGMGEFTLGSSITGPATWDDTNAVIFADTGVDVDGATFRNPNGNHALELTAGAMDIADMRFEGYASKHAILIDTAGTYNFSNVLFDQSGTNDIETTHAAGTVTINVSNGGTVPTVTETGAGSVVVNNNVTVRTTVTDTDGAAIQNARVRITATETVGTITTGDVILTGLTNASGVLETTTFNYEAAFDPSGLDISISVRQGTTSPYKKPFTGTGTITSAGYTTTVALIADE